MANEPPAMPLCTPNQPSSDTPSARPTTTLAPLRPKALVASATVSSRRSTAATLSRLMNTHTTLKPMKPASKVS